VRRLGSLRLGDSAQDGDAPEAADVSSPIVILGTDSGYVVRRNGPDDYDIVYTAPTSLGDHDFEGNELFTFQSTPNSPNEVWGSEGSESNPIYSSDGGLTWQEVSTLLPNSGLGNLIVKDEDGDLYTFFDPDLGPGGGEAHLKLCKSTDQGTTWQVVASPFMIDRGAAGIGEASFGFLNMIGDYIFGVDRHYSEYNIPSGPFTTDYMILVYVKRDGSGFGHILISASTFDNPNVDTVLHGTMNFGYRVGNPSYPTGGRFYSYDSGNGTWLVEWDITPDNVLTAIVSDPAPFGDETVLDVLPITPKITIAHTFDYNFPTAFAAEWGGAIWIQDRDVSSAWVKVVPTTTDLGDGPSGGGDNIDSHTIAVSRTNPDFVVVASAIPYVFISTDSGHTWTRETVTGLDLGGGEEWTTVTVSGGPAAPGCTVDGHNGDIYAWLGVADQIHRYDQTLDLKEIIPVVYTHESGFEDYPLFAYQIRLNGGNLYLATRQTPVPGFDGGTSPVHPHPCIMKIDGSIGHATTILYDLDGNADGDLAIDDLTFDSAGNLYALVETSTVLDVASGSVQLALYKLDPTGSFIWRRLLPSDFGASGISFGPSTFGWLANDDKTFLYLVYRDGGSIGQDMVHRVKRYDLDADAPLPNWFDLTNPYDDTGTTPTRPHFVINHAGTGLLLPNGKMLIGGEVHAHGGTVPDKDGLAYQSDRTIYRAGITDFVAHHVPEGMSLDADPDGVSAWIQDNTNPNIYRFNWTTGTLTKTGALHFEDGDAANFALIALCGGFGGHGNPPPADHPGLARYDGLSLAETWGPAL
jgi:hypothetical protein